MLFSGSFTEEIQCFILYETKFKLCFLSGHRFALELERPYN